MDEKDIRKKKEWSEPKLEKGELLNESTFTAGSQYGSHDSGSGCGIFEKIIKLGRC
jgi:hypothetical protein